MKAHLNKLVPRHGGYRSRKDGGRSACQRDAPLQQGRDRHPALHDHHRIWLDIPNANTLIVDRADTFGACPTLSTARTGGTAGRCGRTPISSVTNKMAPTQDGQQRLEVIAEIPNLAQATRLPCATSKSAGQAICLGTRQHGYIQSVFSSLYEDAGGCGAAIRSSRKSKVKSRRS